MTENQTRLESWKEIAAYLRRDATTAQRWEKEEGLPVHRHSHKRRSSVYAYPSEIDAWRVGRKLVPGPAPDPRPVWRIPVYVLTLLLCLITVGNGIRPVSAKGGLSKRLVCEGACADDEAYLNADGRKMIQPDYPTGDLVLRDLTNGKTLRLLAKHGTFGDGSKEQDAFTENPVLSRDGRRVAYMYSMVEGKSTTAQLRVAGVEPGATPRVILSRPEDGYYQPLAWSTDGKSILILIDKDRDKTQSMAWVSIADGAVKQVASLGWRLRGPHMTPRLSPNGRFVAYAALVVPPKAYRGQLESTDTRIYLLSDDGSGEVELIKDAGIHNNVTWSEDGTHLLFVSDESGQSSWWSIPVRDGKAAGQASIVLADNADKVDALGIRAGSLYYALNPKPADYVSIMRLDGSGPTERFPGTYPSFSPDGKLVAFSRPRPESVNEPNLVIRNLETGDETVFKQQLHMGTVPAPWFPDGKSLLKPVVALENGVEKVETATLVRVDVKTGETSEILNIGNRFLGSSALVSNDSKSLFLVARESEDTSSPFTRIVRFAIDTKEVHPVFSVPRGKTILGTRLSPDGGAILLVVADSSGRSIATVSIEGKSYRELYKDDKNSIVIGGWTVDGKSILFTQRTSDNAKWRVMKIPVEGGTASPTGLEVKNQDVRFLVSPHPDGLRVAYSGRESVSQLWALDNIGTVLK